MSKLIEMEALTDGWLVSMKRVGKDAFAALVSHERRGTSPIVVTRRKAEDLAQLPTDLQKELGCWTPLVGRSAYTPAERLPLTVYGGEGSFNLTPYRILTANSYQDVVEVNNALCRMMNRAVRFARTIQQAA